MTGSELYILTTQFLGGQTLDETLFYQLLNSAKDRREMMRDWMVLRTRDTSITFTSADTYLTGKTLPDRFLRVYTSFDEDGLSDTVFLVTSSGAKVPLQPIKQSQAYEYRNDEGYYYIDIKNGTISRTGTTAGTLWLYYLQGTEDISETGEWDFPAYSHPLLAYDVAVEQKGGIDWDTINANQVPFNQRKIQQLELSLATWDSLLQKAELGV